MSILMAKRNKGIQKENKRKKKVRRKNKKNNKRTTKSQNPKNFYIVLMVVPFNGVKATFFLVFAIRFR